jgi:hypothetical protein
MIRDSERHAPAKPLVAALWLPAHSVHGWVMRPSTKSASCTLGSCACGAEVTPMCPPPAAVCRPRGMAVGAPERSPLEVAARAWAANVDVEMAANRYALGVMPAAPSLPGHSVQRWRMRPGRSCSRLRLRVGPTEPSGPSRPAWSWPCPSGRRLATRSARNDGGGLLREGPSPWKGPVPTQPGPAAAPKRSEQRWA